MGTGRRDARGRGKARRGGGVRAALDTLHGRLRLLVGLVSAMWVEELVDTVLGGRLDGLGIRPRVVEGLTGVPLAPFLHVGFGHLAANTVPLLVLGAWILLRGRAIFAAVTSFVVATGGLGVWLVGGAGTVHLGASGLVFGWLGFAMLVGLVERRILSALGSLVVARVYGAALVGVLPGVPGISWESHLAGFLSGALAAWLFARRDAGPRRAA